MTIPQNQLYTPYYLFDFNTTSLGKTLPPARNAGIPLDLLRQRSQVSLISHRDLAHHSLQEILIAPSQIRIEHAKLEIETLPDQIPRASVSEIAEEASLCQPCQTSHTPRAATMMPKRNAIRLSRPARRMIRLGWTWSAS